MVVQRAHVAHRARRGGASEVRIRYDFLDHLRLACRRYEVILLAFGFDDQGIRLVLEGSRPRLRSVWSSAWYELQGRRASFADGPSPRNVEHHHLTDAVVWAHLGPAEASPGLPGPLASPWSSHRDLMGYREAAFYDRSEVADRVDLGTVHRRCGGGPPPTAADLRRDCCVVRRPGRRGDGPREPLLHLSRVAASVVGREPADPKSFGLFAHLATARGWTVREVADALLVSSRRVRQLLDRQAQELALAYTALMHPDSVGRLP